MRRLPTAVVIVLALTVVGCDPAHDLAIDNQSDQDFIARITDTTSKDLAPAVTYYKVPAHSNRYAFPPDIGPLEGTVDVLDAKCNLVGTIPARGNAVITIHDDLTLDIESVGGQGQSTSGQFTETSGCP